MAFERGIRRNEQAYERLRRLLVREAFAPDVTFDGAHGWAEQPQAAPTAPVWRELRAESARRVEDAAAIGGGVPGVTEIERRPDDDRRAARGGGWTIEQWLELVDHEQRRHSRPFE